MKSYLTASEAAAELGIGIASLYAYVSRGMIRSEPQPGARTKLYFADDVRALRGARAGRQEPTGAQADPIAIETTMTLIADGRLYYRGIDVEELARDGRLEAIATLLWETSDLDPFKASGEFMPVLHAALTQPVIVRLLIDLTAASERDLAGFARSPDAVARCGARILSQAVATITQAQEGRGFLHERLASSWARPQAANLIRIALVILADHELAASTFAVRVAASTGASPWRAIAAGLACLDGPRHGGAGERVAAFLATINDPLQAETAIARRLRAGEDVPGFGHQLYRDIDPRCRALLQAAAMLAPTSAPVELARRLTVAAEKLIGRQPNLDFGLVIACQAADLPEDAPLALFALGRIVGWIGHIIEQVRSPALLRPRARYVGQSPT